MVPIRSVRCKHNAGPMWAMNINPILHPHSLSGTHVKSLSGKLMGPRWVIWGIGGNDVKLPRYSPYETHLAHMVPIRSVRCKHDAGPIWAKWVPYAPYPTHMGCPYVTLVFSPDRTTFNPDGPHIFCYLGKQCLILWKVFWICQTINQLYHVILMEKPLLIT